MVWFQCEDCGETLKKKKITMHFRFCAATKLSCIDCGQMFGQDNVSYHNQCFAEAINMNKSEQHPNLDINVGLSNHYPWFCSLCNTEDSSQQNLLHHANGKKHRAQVAAFYAKQQQGQSKHSMVDKYDSRKHTEVDINVGLSTQPPWACSLCNTVDACQKNLLSHANGRKHRANVAEFYAKQQQQQSKHSTVDKDESRKHTEVDINVGLSTQHPWFCSLCNRKVVSQHDLISHANGRFHRANVELFDAKQQQLEESTLDKRDIVENASDVNSEQKKVDFLVSSDFANGYSQPDKKRKLDTFNETRKEDVVVQAEEVEGVSEKNIESKKAKKLDSEKKGKEKRKLKTFSETWNGDAVVQAEEAEGRGEKKSEPKKSKKLDSEKKGKEDKKQTSSDSDFEYDKEDIKLMLVSYSKEELVNLIYKTAEKGSRLLSAILETADRDIAQRNIFVRGFGWDTTHKNLKAVFESYGEIEECSVVMDKDTGRGKGYGFVLFKTRKGAREALRNPEKRLYNRIVVCNLASKKPCWVGKVQDIAEPVKIDLTNRATQSSDAVLPGLDLGHAHEHVLEKRHHQQQTMDMFRQNMPFYGHSQLPGFDPMYGAPSSNQMIAGPPNYCMFGSGYMSQGSMLPPLNHMGMAGQYFGDGDHSWYQR